MSSTTHQTRSNTINDNDVNILEIILFQNLSSLQRIASTCKKWKEVTLEFCDEQKMKYLKYNTNTSQTQLLEELEIEIFNCSYGKSFSITQIVKKIIKISHKKLKINYDLSKPTIPFSIRVNSKKANKLGWKPKHKIDEGIRKTINWCLKNEFL